MAKITQAEAEKAAQRYLDAQLELKSQKEEEKAALSTLRAYCKENPDVETIGPVMAYTKSFAPKLIGAKSAVENVIKKLRATYVNLVSDKKKLDENTEMIGLLKTKGFTIRIPDVEMMSEMLVKDSRLSKLLDDNDVKIESKEEYYFKHI